MFSNIGRKIKIVAKVVFVLGIVLTILAALFGVNSSTSFTVNGRKYYVTDNSGTFLSLLIILAVGFVSSWLSSIFIYGFGELIERTCGIDDKVALLLSNKEMYAPKQGSGNPE